MEYRMDPDGWERRVAGLVVSRETGWDLPPLIAQVRGDELSVRDGNHRLAALERLGRPVAWALLWFDSVVDRKGFRAISVPD